MKIATVIFGVLSAALWLWAATIRLPVGVGSELYRKATERKIGWLNAAAATASAVTAVLSAFSN